MRVLIIANTPAHVHLYRHTVTHLEDDGHDVRILAREYACTTDLLEYFELPYRVYGTHETTAYSVRQFVPELASQCVSIARNAVQFNPDVVFGRGPYAALAGTLTRTPVVLVLDDEPADYTYTSSRPFADCILSPAVTRRDLGTNHYTFNGFKECAYLHPDVFTPSPTIRSKLGVGPTEPYVLLRFNAFDALQDTTLEGFTTAQRYDLIETLSEHATVFVSDEGNTIDCSDTPARRYNLHPALIHDTLSEASLLVADTGTMVTEAALLGTPALRYQGTDDHEYGEFAALEEAGLAAEYTAYTAVCNRAQAILEDQSLQTQWKQRRDDYTSQLVNLTTLLVDVATTRGTVDSLSPAHKHALQPRAG